VTGSARANTSHKDNTNNNNKKKKPLHPQHKDTKITPTPSESPSSDTSAVKDKVQISTRTKKARHGPHIVPDVWVDVSGYVLPV
jgi:hypothetical protein